jgi:hypothetical protein
LNLQETTEQKKVQIYLQGDLMAIKKNNFADVYMRNISQYDSGERCGPWASCFIMYYRTKLCKSMLTYNLFLVSDKGEDDIVEEKLEVLQARLAEKGKLLDEARRRVEDSEDKLHKCRLLKPFPKPLNASLPTIYLITPTYDRIEQKAELTRLYYTFLHVPNIHWILVEDSETKTDKIRHFLAKCQIPYTHLNVATPPQVKLKSSDPNWLKPRGVLQRNAGLMWIRASLDPHKDKGVVYFADDDNTYSIQLFEEVIHVYNLPGIQLIYGCSLMR